MTSVVDADALPETLREYDQWICWREDTRDGDPTKLPVDPQTGALASTTDSETWTDYEDARKYAKTNDIGLGFVFTERDSLVGVDLDKCRDSETGQPEEWAKDIVQDLDSYAEVSPSGTGYHVLLEGSLPEGGNRSGNVEMYEDARFFTMTGDHVDGTPEHISERQQTLEAVHGEYIAEEPKGATDDESSNRENILDDEELIERATQASNGEKFERLWNGSTSGYESHSEADMALCFLLAFWTGGDAEQMDRLFRDSGLYREKWDERHYNNGDTYGERTIERAIHRTDDFYDPDGRSDSLDRDEQETPAPAPVLDERIVALDADVERLEARISDLEAENERLREALETQREQYRALEARLDELEAEEDSKSSGWSPFR